jgi:uncharacterized protein YqfA (UPF0365 family)
MNVTRLIYNDAVVFVAALLCVVLLSIAFLVLVVKPWLRAFLHGTPVSLIHVVGMRLRGNPPAILVDAYIQLHRAGLEPTIAELEHCYIDSRSRIITSWDLVDVFSRNASDRSSSRNNS